MALPGTSYTTTDFLPIRINRLDEEHPYFQELPKETNFSISLNNNPADIRLEIELDSLDLLLEKTPDLQGLDPSIICPNVSAETFSNKAMLTSDFGQAIYFYSALAAYGEFSNFSDHGLEYNGLYYPTVEHFYQSQKFEDANYREKIRKAATPKLASELGKTRLISLKADWDTLKNEVMTIAIHEKFEQHEKLKAILLNTENRLLIENSPYDNYWGIGRAGIGKNHLGTVLMRLRKKLTV